jgi:hypothetical protein
VIDFVRVASPQGRPYPLAIGVAAMSARAQCIYPIAVRITHWGQCRRGRDMAMALMPLNQL